MKKILIFSFFILFLFNNVFGQWTVENVPDPMQNSGFVSNPDGILSDSTVAYLNSIIKSANDSNYVQIAVLMLSSIGSVEPKTFANEILNKWGVGNKELNNGLVIVFVMDQRTVSFETGYGIEAVITDAECYTIQQNYMVPYFKDSKYDEGIINGVSTVIEEAKTDNYLLISSGEDIIDQYGRDDNNEKVRVNFFKSGFFMMYVGLTIVLTLLFIVSLIIAFTLSDRYKRYQSVRFFSMIILAVIFPIPFVIIVLFIRKLMDVWRNTPRISPAGKLLHKLDEKEDDEYLKKGQVTEEQVKSIDYDVWVSDDKEDILILAYKRWFTKYSQCPKCKFKTYYLVYDRVITPATYSSSGKGEKKYSCANCHHTVIRTYTIPKKQQTSSSSGSYGSYGGGGSSSWGGGSSGGGGASSSW